MTQSLIDELSPVDYGEDRFDLALSNTTPTPRAFQPCIINVDCSRCLPEGIVLPLELRIVGPSGESTQTIEHFRHLAPNEIAFRPREGGSTLVMLRELYHNRWWGKLVVDVAGDALDLE